MATATPGHDSAHGHDEIDDHNYTSLGLDNVKLGFWCFLGSECFFFGSLIGTYMSYRGKSLTGPYPVEVFSVHVTSISTFLLLMSSVTMVLAVAAAKQNNVRPAQLWILATAALGTCFVSFQGYEFTHFYEHNLTLQGNLFGSSFFTLTGFHGAHVTIGVIWLLTLTFWLQKGWITGDKGTIVEVAGLYWHFVDIVWIVIFTLVYLMQYT